MSTTVSTSVSELREVLEDFVDDLEERLDAHELEDVLRRGRELTSRDLGLDDSDFAGYAPERWVENHLIDDTLDALGFSWEPQPYGLDDDRPDFEVRGLEVSMMGENKSLNKIEAAEKDLRAYLRNKAIGPDHGIATDGFEWTVMKIELGGDFAEYPRIKDRLSLKGPITQIAVNKGYISSSADPVDIDDLLEEFVEVFETDAFNRLLTKTAPKELRDLRKNSIEEFYDLYIELLFGEGEEDHGYETTLMDDLKPPTEAEESDNRMFAITLMNRLLFIKFLETKGVLDEEFLQQRVDAYEAIKDDLAGNLYQTQLKPLFYELFNTPKGEDRDSKYQTGWFDDVPYLNGGLFRENIEAESAYDVQDRILLIVVRDLIEGSEIHGTNGQMDPSIIGNVFEKTITHIEHEREQKDVGAYYTPNDVTNIITRQTVDQKVRDTLIDEFSDAFSEDEGEHLEVREFMEDELGLAEILRKVEDREETVIRRDGNRIRLKFGEDDTIQRGIDAIQNLKLLDPACGSGHFLTTGMDEIHRAQISLMRGLNGGEDPDGTTIFTAKTQLALNAIYGVDAEPIGCEIAKLRVWLKIIEDGWEPEYGRLPNIDVNIISGNSLVGLPLKGFTDVSLDIADVYSRIDEVMDLRQQYKYEDEGDRLEIDRLEKEIRPELNKEFLKQLNYTVETKVQKDDDNPREHIDTFQELLDSIDDDLLHTKLLEVRVKRVDGEALSEDELDRLGRLGFEWQEWRESNVTVKLDVQQRERSLRDRGTEDPKGTIIDDLVGLLEDGYNFPKVKRRPVEYDMNQIFGEPFHWIAEFPEVVPEDGNGRHSVAFDIILGNPPYGDLMNKHEKTFIAPYNTSEINDISAQFVERQLQLLGENGYFGNITTLRLVYQSSLEPLHTEMRDTLENNRIACFGFRPSRVFDDAHVRTSIMTGQKTPDAEDEQELLTSDLLLLTDENRQERFEDIEYNETTDFVLRDKIGGETGSRAILPKIGPDTKQSILQRLKENSDRVFRNAYTRDPPYDDAYKLYKRRGVLYWINPMLEELYGGSEVEEMWFETEAERDIGFLIMNSSLYFVYWQTYANQHHHNWSHIKPFPFPEQDDVEPRADELREMADELWEAMKNTFTQSREGRGDFHMRPLKPLINEVDEMLADIYGLSEEELAYVQNYLTDLGPNSGRAGPTDEAIDSF